MSYTITSIHCVISGEDFSAQSNIKLFENSFNEFYFHEKGDISPITRKPFLDSCIRVTEKHTENDREGFLTSFLESILKKVNHLVFYARLDISIDINLKYHKQCNFELSQKEVKLLSKIGATFSLSCYEV